MKRCLLLIAALLAGSSALAQSYPSQPVKLLVGFPPGGTTDVIGRLVAQELAAQTGKSFLVENRGGASGTIGAGIVAKSAPNGHTLIVVPSTYGTATALYTPALCRQRARPRRADRDHAVRLRRASDHRR